MLLPPTTLAALPLGVDISALAEVIGVFIVFIAWIFRQINEVVKQAKRTPQQQPMPRPEEQPAEAGAAPAPSRDTKLTDEIEQFLRDAAERRSGRPPAPKEMVPPGRPGGKQNRGNRGRRGREPLTQNPLDQAAPPKPPEKSPVRESVSTSVQSHLDTHQFADRAAHLTSVPSEQKIDEHLHQAFDHELSKLAGTTLESRGATAGVTDKAAIVATSSQMSEAAGPATPGSSLASLLLDPSNLKNAVILNEILQRPTYRWEDDR